MTNPPWRSLFPGTLTGTLDPGSRFGCVRTLLEDFAKLKDPGFLTSAGILLVFEIAFAAVLLLLTKV
jgi:hypothetical protein